MFVRLMPCLAAPLLAALGACSVWTSSSQPDASLEVSDAPQVMATVSAEATDPPALEPDIEAPHETAEASPLVNRFVVRPELYPVADIGLKGILTKRGSCLLIENVGNRDNLLTLFPSFDATYVSWNGEALITPTQEIGLGDEFWFSGNLGTSDETIEECGVFRGATISIK